MNVELERQLEMVTMKIGVRGYVKKLPDYLYDQILSTYLKCTWILPAKCTGNWFQII